MAYHSIHEIDWALSSFPFAAQIALVALTFHSIKLAHQWPSKLYGALGPKVMRQPIQEESSRGWVGALLFCCTGQEISVQRSQVYNSSINHVLVESDNSATYFVGV